MFKRFYRSVINFFKKIFDFYVDETILFGEKGFFSMQILDLREYLYILEIRYVLSEYYKIIFEFIFLLIFIFKQEKHKSLVYFDSVDFFFLKNSLFDYYILSNDAFFFKKISIQKKNYIAMFKLLIKYLNIYDLNYFFNRNKFLVYKNRLTFEYCNFVFKKKSNVFFLKKTRELYKKSMSDNDLSFRTDDLLTVVKNIDKIKSDNFFMFLYKNFFFNKNLYYLIGSKFSKYFEYDLLKKSYMNNHLNDVILYRYFFYKKEKNVYNYIIDLFSEGSLNKRDKKNMLFCDFSMSYLFSEFSFGRSMFDELNIDYDLTSKVSGFEENNLIMHKNIAYTIFPFSKFDKYYFSIKENKTLAYYISQISKELLLYENISFNINQKLKEKDYDFNLLERFVLMDGPIVSSSLGKDMNFSIKSKYDLKRQNIIQIEALPSMFNIYLDIYFFSIFESQFTVFFLGEIFYPRSFNILLIPSFYEIIFLNLKVINFINLNKIVDCGDYLSYFLSNLNVTNFSLWQIYGDLLVENYFYKVNFKARWQKNENDLMNSIFYNLYDKYGVNYILFDLEYDFYYIYNDILRQSFFKDQDKIAFLNIEKNKFINYNEVISFKFERFYNSVILPEEVYNKLYTVKNFFVENKINLNSYWLYNFDDIFDVIKTNAGEDLGIDSNGRKVKTQDEIDEELFDKLGEDKLRINYVIYKASDSIFVEFLNAFLNPSLRNQLPSLDYLYLDFDNFKSKQDETVSTKIKIRQYWKKKKAYKYKYMNESSVVTASDGFSDKKYSLLSYDSDYYSKYDLMKSNPFNVNSYKFKNYFNYNYNSYNFFYFDYLLIFIFLYYYIYIVKFFIVENILNMEYNKKVADKYLFGPFTFFRNRISLKYSTYFDYSYEFFGTYERLFKLSSSANFFYLAFYNFMYILKQKIIFLYECAFDFSYFAKFNVKIFSFEFRIGFWLQSFIFYPVYLYKITLELMIKFYKFAYDYGNTFDNIIYEGFIYSLVSSWSIFFWEYFLFDPIEQTAQNKRPFEGLFSDYTNFMNDDMFVSSIPFDSLGFNGFLADLDQRFIYEYEFLSPVLPIRSSISSVNFFVLVSFIKDILILFFIRFVNFMYFDFIFFVVSIVNKIFFSVLMIYSIGLYILCLLVYYFFLFFKMCVLLVFNNSTNKMGYINNKIVSVMVYYIYLINLMFAISMDYVFNMVSILIKSIYKSGSFIILKIPFNFFIFFFRWLFYFIKIVILMCLKFFFFYLLVVFFFDNYDALVFYFYSIVPFKISTNTYFFVHGFLVFISLIVLFYPLRVSFYLWMQRYWIITILVCLWLIALLKNNEFFYLLPLFDKIYMEGHNIVYGYHFLRSYFLNWRFINQFFNSTFVVLNEYQFATVNMGDLWMNTTFINRTVDDIGRDLVGIYRQFIKPHLPKINYKAKILPYLQMIVKIPLQMPGIRSSTAFVDNYFYYNNVFNVINNVYLEKISLFFYNVYLQTLYVDSVFFNGLYDIYMHGFANVYFDKDKVWEEYLASSLIGGRMVLNKLPVYAIYPSTSINYTYLDELFLKKYVEKTEKYYRYNSVFLNSILSAKLKRYKKHLDYDLLELKSKKRFLKTFWKYKNMEFLGSIKGKEDTPYLYHFGVRNIDFFKKHLYAFYNNRNWPIYSDYFYTSLYNNQLKYAEDYSFFLVEKDFPKVKKSLIKSYIDKGFFDFLNRVLSSDVVNEAFLFPVTPIRRLYRFNSIKSVYYFSQNNMLSLKNLLSYNSNFDYLKYYLYINQSKLIDAADLFFDFANPLSVFNFNKRLNIFNSKNRRDFLVTLEMFDVIFNRSNFFIKLKSNFGQLILKDYFNFKSGKISGGDFGFEIYKGLFDLINLKLNQSSLFVGNKGFINLKFVHKNVKSMFWHLNELFSIENQIKKTYFDFFQNYVNYELETKSFLNKTVVSSIYQMWYFVMPVFLKQYEQRLLIKSYYKDLMENLDLVNKHNIQNFYFPRTMLSSFLLTYELPFNFQTAGFRRRYSLIDLGTKMSVYKRLRKRSLVGSSKRFRKYFRFYNKYPGGFRKRFRKRRFLSRMYSRLNFMEKDSFIDGTNKFLNSYRYNLVRSFRYGRQVKVYRRTQIRVVSNIWTIFNKWSINMQRHFRPWNVANSMQKDRTLSFVLGFFNRDVNTTYKNELDNFWSFNYETNDDNFDKILYNKHGLNKLKVKRRDRRQLLDPQGTYNLKGFNKILNDDYLNVSILNYISKDLRYGALHQFNYKYNIYSFPRNFSIYDDLWYDLNMYVYPLYVKFFYENDFYESQRYRVIRGFGGEARNSATIYNKYLLYNKFYLYGFNYNSDIFVGHLMKKKSFKFKGKKKRGEVLMSLLKTLYYFKNFGKLRIKEYSDVIFYNDNIYKIFDDFLKINKNKFYDFTINLNNVGFLEYTLKEVFFNNLKKNKNVKYYIEGRKMGKNLLLNFSSYIRKGGGEMLLPFELYNISKKRSLNKYYKGAFIDVWSTSTWKTKYLNKPYLKRYYFDTAKIFSKNKFYRFRNLQSYYALAGEQILYRNDVDSKYFYEPYRKIKKDNNYVTLNKNKAFGAYITGALTKFRYSLWGKIEPNLDHFFYFYRGNNQTLLKSSEINREYLKKFADKEKGVKRRFQGLLRFNENYDTSRVRSTLDKNKYKKMSISRLNNLILNEFNLNLKLSDNILLNEYLFDKNVFIKKKKINDKKKLNKMYYYSRLKKIKFRDLSDYNLKKNKFRRKYVERNFRKAFKLSRMDYQSLELNDFFEQSHKRYHKGKQLKLKDKELKFISVRDREIMKLKNRKARRDLNNTRYYWYKFLVPDIGYFGSSFWGRDFNFMNYDLGSYESSNYYRVIEEGGIYDYNNLGKQNKSV